MQRDDVLNTYFEKLRRDLSTCEKFIIFGNSMVNEPHLKELMRDSLNAEATVFVCSRHPAEIKRQIKNYVHGPIVELSTAHITTERELADLLLQALD